MHFECAFIFTLSSLLCSLHSSPPILRTSTTKTIRFSTVLERIPFVSTLMMYRSPYWVPHCGFRVRCFCYYSKCSIIFDSATIISVMMTKFPSARASTCIIPRALSLKASRSSFSLKYSQLLLWNIWKCTHGRIRCSLLVSSF